ncbi:adhesion G-protein coupled receptor G2 [Myxocyprinus asiaticus]|uniref:adhesion G-protein coupled receptor G2 n=1 Tax=Myxocyprinus asiaticus TaxID=70543 RepID=UPI0022223E0F|nr:adhesion G-protein coupled receptor G2 [Myxocyprinus asiaticus]
MLEMLSGMKWYICGLLLILPEICKTANSNNANKPKCKHNYGKKTKNDCPLTTGVQGSSNPEVVVNDMFLLGADGFMGYMKTVDCINGSWNLSDVILGCDSTELPDKTLLNITVFSFDDGENCTANISSCTSSSCKTYCSDYGVYLSKNTSGDYQISINRNSIPTFVCLFAGNCLYYNWSNWIKRGCNWTNLTPSSTCNMTCLDPTEACQSAHYEHNCSDANASDESKVNTIKIKNQNGTCFKCGSPFQVLESVSVPAEIASQFNKTETNAVAAAGVMKNLSNMLFLMGNLTIATVSMGNIQGVVKKIEAESDIRTSAFIYSSDTGIRAIDDFAALQNYPNAFIVPKEATLKAFNQSSGKAFLGLFQFPNMTKDENNSVILNDQVYAIEMGTKISNLRNNIELSFQIIQDKKLTPTCHAWDGSGNKPNWNTDGCNTTIEKNKVTCKCEHLTFFAVLMAPVKDISQQDLISLTYITYIGCGLSMFFLGIGLFMHFLLRRAKASNSVHVLINVFVALFLLNVAFLSNEYVARAKDLTACRIMAGFMHYSLLASFTWFGLEAFHLCMQMSKYSVTIKHYIIKMTVAGWVPPGLVVTIIFFFGKYGEQTIHTDTGNNVTMCWILDINVHYIVNIGYYSFIFIFTFSIFIVVLRWLCMLRVNKWSKTDKVKHSGTATSDITTVMGLCCLLGLTWSFTFFSYGALQIPSYYISTILNSFQGFFLFIYYLKSSTLIGEAEPSEQSSMSGETNTENPYDKQLSTTSTKSCD